MKISKVDEKNLRLIRRTVDKLLNKIKKYDINGYNILEIGPKDFNFKSSFNKAKVYTTDYKPGPVDFVMDICENNESIIKNNSFDMVVCTEVLEHTTNPFNAVIEIYRILKPKGIVYVTTPFDFRIHGPLPDCWRFTEHGLKELFKNFKKIKIKNIKNKKRYLMPVQYLLKATK
jgi:SAM-dependent methyltransferase